MKTIDLIRHTANDGDQLTSDGIARAVEIGGGLSTDYALAASSGAQRASQTIGCVLAGMGRALPGGVVVVPELRSTMEDRWRAAYQVAGAGDLRSLREADEELVEADSQVLAAGLREVFALLAEGERALAVGHSPTNEAAVYGLTGVTIEPMGKGDVVVVTEDDGAYSVGEPAVPAAGTGGDEQTLRHFKTVLWPQAYRTQDVDLLDSLLHDTFEMIDAEGNRSTKQQELEYVASNAWDPGEFEYRIERLQLYGDRCAVIDGTGVASTYTYKSSNVLIKQDGAWRAVASHVSGVESTA